MDATDSVDFDSIFDLVDDDGPRRDGAGRTSDARGDGSHDEDAEGRDGDGPAPEGDDGDWVDLEAEYGARESDLTEDDEEDDLEGVDDGEEEDPRRRSKDGKPDSAEARLAKLEAELAQKEEERYVANLRATHDAQREENDAIFREELAVLVRQMNRSGNPEKFYWEKVAPKEAERADWHRQFNASAAKVYQAREIRKELPGRVAQLCEKLGLPDAAVDELLDNYSVQQIPREAKRMQKEMRERERLLERAQQASRSGAARAISNRGINAGRGSGGRVVAKSGSDEELAWILAQPGDNERAPSGRRKARR